MAEYRRLGRPTDTNTRIRELAHAHTRDDVYPFQPAPEEDRSLAWPWPTVHNQINLVADCTPPRTFNPRRCCLRDSLIMFDLLPSTAERKRHHVIIILYTYYMYNIELYIYIFILCTYNVLYFRRSDGENSPETSGGYSLPPSTYNAQIGKADLWPKKIQEKFYKRLIIQL